MEGTTQSLTLSSLTVSETSQFLSDQADVPSSALLRCPNEVLEQLLSFLDAPPPSATSLIHLPNPACTSKDSSTNSLKTFSLISHRMRNLALRRLFRHVVIDPIQLTPFLEFIHEVDLASSVTSIVAILRDPYKHYHPAWWCRLLNELRPLRLAVCCAPDSLQSLSHIDVDLTHWWAFRMPFHFLELNQSPTVAIQDISYDFPNEQVPGILGAKSWYKLYINEGSSLAAYTTFEYFLKTPPSLASSVHTVLNAIPRDATVDIITQMFPVSASSIFSIQHMLLDLSEFSFVAIFPFYNHVDNVLKFIRRMVNLTKLFIKLCPEPNTTVLDDEIKAAKGHFDINDPWNEITTAYHLVAHTVRYMGSQSKLQVLKVDDVRVEGIRDNITTIINDLLPETWTYENEGTWVKKYTSVTTGPLTLPPDPS